MKYLLQEVGTLCPSGLLYSASLSSATALWTSPGVSKPILYIPNLFQNGLEWFLAFYTPRKRVKSSLDPENLYVPRIIFKELSYNVEHLLR
jgi:hypothetical protein